jgi:D-glycero-alpha-D-manno-heptose 1-phosphate guanylyltransferase
MEAVILAGGLGTRLRSVVPDLPKPIRTLSSKGFKRFILSIGYRAEVISQYFGDSFLGIPIEYVVENSPLGTGGGVRLSLTRCSSDHAFIFNGDTFLDLEVGLVETLWQRERRPIIVGRSVAESERYGRLLLKEDRVVGFIEKGMKGPGYINAGCYVFGTRQLDAWPTNQPFCLETDALPQILAEPGLSYFETQGLFIDIGVPEDFLRAASLLGSY